jgi:hypothetical protein
MEPLFSLLLIAFMMSCKPSHEDSSNRQTKGSSQTALVPKSWIEERVNAGR